MLSVTQQASFWQQFLLNTDTSSIKYTRLYACLQVADCRSVTNSQGALGLLTVPIDVLREQEAERVSDQAAAVGEYSAGSYIDLI